MRPDGDPEPDDYGLPRVDVVVPDDARELERDMVAYRREERRRRRRERRRRILRPVTRFGVAIPIIAGALLIALLSGALMTAFGPRPAPRPTAAQLAPRPSASPGRIGGLLPAGQVDLVAREHAPQPLEDVRPGVIGIVPPGYRCEPVVAELAGKTEAYDLNFWLVADPRAAAGRRGLSIKDLKACAGTAHNGTPLILEDRKAILATAYVPAVTAPPLPPPSGTTAPATSPGASPPASPGGTPAPPAEPGPRLAGLTAVFVQPDGVVNDVVHAPQAGAELTEKVKALRSG
ncbi:hypothetical protein AGRA3207_005279 [Actinomadura graeca]|uniref:Uncharacterized protein n=1 Tax=Actinomadura graeca TaxID=2750812 RepID=A0ABX8QZ53_9ACTN|nr:hypothetical protein [Actinomadura graeca]QXJ24032.1 hypothetical protein AGRA3207_005279 [Actinomadura graeca]